MNDELSEILLDDEEENSSNEDFPEPGSLYYYNEEGSLGKCIIHKVHTDQNHVVVHVKEVGFKVLRLTQLDECIRKSPASKVDKEPKKKKKNTKRKGP